MSIIPTGGLDFSEWLSREGLDLNTVDKITKKAWDYKDLVHQTDVGQKLDIIASYANNGVVLVADPVTDVTLVTTTIGDSLSVDDIVSALTSVGGDGVAFRITSQDVGDYFKIVGANLVVAATISFPTTINVTVEAYDSKGSTFSKEYTVTLTHTPFGVTHALSFDGTNEYFEILNQNMFDVETYSYSFWVKVEAGVNEFLFGTSSPLIIGGYMYFDNSNNRLRYTYFTAGVTQLGLNSDIGSFTPNVWHHVVMSISAGTNHFIIDGVKSAVSTYDQADYGGHFRDELFKLSIASKYSGAGVNNSYAECLLTEFMFLPNHLITLAEAQEIYNNGVPKDLKDLSLDTSGGHWWRLGTDFDGSATMPDEIGDKDLTVYNIDPSNKTTDIPT